MEEKHGYRLIRDLFAYKDAIFNELKRMSTMTHSNSVGSNAPRPRAISTDESNRKALTEERNRLLLEKAGRSRATSPAPSPRGGAPGHRRDRSTGGPDTRFPIASPTVAVDRHRSSLVSLPGVKRQSLEVPGAAETGSPDLNGSQHEFGGGSVTSKVVETVTVDGSLEKRNSLGRSGARFSGTGRRLPINPSSGADSPRGRPTGVTLEDRPMQD